MCVLQSVLFGIVYAFIEGKYVVNTVHATPNNLFSPYRLLYFVLFLVATYVTPYTHWLAYWLISMSVEDLFYWVVIGKKPYRWTWYYLVWYGVPVVDVVELVIAVVLLTPVTNSIL